MDERRDVRASDRDREAAVERLRSALNEGRLNVLEYDERLARAYQSVTYGELADLFVDLPAPGSSSASAAEREVTPSRRSPKPMPASPGALAFLPTSIKVLWTIWLTAVSINLIIWVLVSVSNVDLVYFWPMWVAGPAGAGLLGVSTGAVLARRSRYEARLAKKKKLRS
jgi:DUF1707 SHOCT-like domain